MRIRVTNLQTGESVVIAAPGVAKIEGEFAPDGSGTVTYDLSGQNVLLPAPLSDPVEAAAAGEFGLPEFAIVYGKFVGTTFIGPDGEATSAVIQRAGNRVVDVCDLL